MRRNNRKIRSLVKIGQQIFHDILEDGVVTDAESLELMSYADHLHQLIQEAITEKNPQQCYMAYTTAKVMIDGLSGDALANQAKKDGYDPDMVLFMADNVVSEQARNNPGSSRQSQIEDELEDVGFPSMAESLRDGAVASDYHLYIRDLHRARRENTEDELPTSVYNHVKSLLDEWFTIADQPLPMRRNGRNLGYGINNGGMARNQLRTIARISKDFHDMLRDDDELPAWVLSKITVAQDRLVVARNYIASKLEDM